MGCYNNGFYDNIDFAYRSSNNGILFAYCLWSAQKRISYESSIVKNMLVLWTNER